MSNCALNLCGSAAEEDARDAIDLDISASDVEVDTSEGEGVSTSDISVSRAH